LYLAGSYAPCSTVYGRIKTSYRKQTNTDKLPEDIDDVIDKIMKYELEMLVPDIDDHIFNNNDKVDNDIGDNEEETTMNACERVARKDLTDLFEMGWNKLGEMNVKKERMVTGKCTQRKRKTTQYKMDRIAVMKQNQ
jgi:hypothetical protein